MIQDNIRISYNKRMEGRKMIWGDLVMHDDDDTVDIVVSNVDLVDLLMRWGC